MHKLFKQEAEIITKFFQANGIRAKVERKLSIEVLTGYFRFGLSLHPTERFARVESVQRELTSVLSQNRQKQGFDGNIHVMPTSNPLLALETPHPSPKILTPNNNLYFTGAPHTMAVGRSYLHEPKEEIADLADNPHYLLAGITNAGKSVLAQGMLLSLAARTSPEHLKICLIDLKNEDLVPLVNLPHVLHFAGTEDEAMKVLYFVNEEKLKRIQDPGYKPYRLVLVVDEMAHLASNTEARDILGKLATIGRSKDINLIGATQHPTQQGGLGALMKANFTTRFVGQVAPGQSQYATNRPNTHAELLPGKGSFLRCSGPTVYRLQSYYIPFGEVRNLANRIRTMWKVDTPRIAPKRSPAPVLVSPPPTVTFPIGEGRKLSHEEVMAVRSLATQEEFRYGGKLSLSRLTFHVYGYRNSQVQGNVEKALEGIQ